MSWDFDFSGVPTKAAPFGCVVVLAGIALVGYALACDIWLLRFGSRKALEADMSDPDEAPIMR
jgi:hypothetical protein